MVHTKWKIGRNYTSYWASLVAQRLKHLPAMWETWVRSLGQEDSPGEGNGNPLQYSCLENPMDRGAWQATVHRVTKSRTRLSDFTFTYTSYWRRKWQPTPVFLPGISHGWRSLVGYSPWGRKESDVTEQLYFILPTVKL